jgi:hypothetical protein
MLGRRGRAAEQDRGRCMALHEVVNLPPGTVGDGRCRYLVVANQTLGSRVVHDAVVARAARSPAGFHLLVPATRIEDQDGSLVGSEHLRAWAGEDLGFALARYRLARARQRLEDEGLAITGSVGPPDPLAAIVECLAATVVDEILLSSLPRRSSRWLRGGLLRRLQRVTDLPISHLEATPVG